MKSAAFGLLISVALLAGACGSETTQQSTDGEAVAVMPGKADNYLSPTSREYTLEGMGDLALDSAEWAEKTQEERDGHVEEILEYRFKAYGHFINEYITDKSSHDDNQEYGGFAGLIRGSSLEFIYEPVDDAGLQYVFLWEMEMGGPRDLMDRLPLETNVEGKSYFLVTLPKLTESQLKYASYPKAFNPETFDGDTEEIEVVVSPEDESFDAFPEYDRLFADGVLDVLVVVGGDYNEERYDLKATEEIYNWLKRAGYDHPTSNWKELTLDSPDFTKTLRVNGKDVAVRVQLLHPDIVEDSNLDALREKIIEAYKTRDVVMYDGHAGQDPSYSGVVYHYNPRHAISADDLGQLELPEKYQIYVFNGCKTYNAYPPAVYANEAKTEENLDIISTVNFSWLTMQPFTTSGFLNQLTAKSAGNHDPQTYVEILSAINKSNNWNVYYGVHGLDDNPHVNPYADLTTLCEECGNDSDCPGAGNRCVRYEWGSACGAECTANDGCPEGYFCGDIAVGTQVVGHQCMPFGYQCN